MNLDSVLEFMESARKVNNKNFTKYNGVENCAIIENLEFLDVHIFRFTLHELDTNHIESRGTFN